MQYSVQHLTLQTIWGLHLFSENPNSVPLKHVIQLWFECLRCDRQMEWRKSFITYARISLVFPTQHNLQILIFCWPCISIYLFININQLEALNFIISLFQASKCFEHMCSKHAEAWNKLIIKFSASSWLILIINILRCTVSKILQFQDYVV